MDHSTTESPAFQSDQTLESGLVGAFRFFLALRLLMWFMLYFSDAELTARPELSALGIQTFVLTFIPDALVLTVLLWPPLRHKINQGHFTFILVLSTAVLLFGQASVLSFREFDGLPLMVTHYTPYSIFFFVMVLFVAWQYDLVAVLLYGAVVTSLLLLLLWYFGLLTSDHFRLTLFVSILTIVLPGWLIARLMTQQRQQRAALAAAAKEQARTNEQLVHYAASLEELTISRERNRLARELHDTLAHSLSAVTVQLGAVETLWGSNPDAAKDLLTQADSSARGGLEEARRALQALRASPLEDLGLVLALEALTNDAAERTSATLHVDMPEENLTFLEPHVEQSIYRVAQEALENCVRHAAAQQIWVTLSHSNEMIELLIRDDGQGFDPSREAPSGHYGTAGMKERASVIGGKLLITSEMDEGTTIRLTVPIT